MPRFHLYKFRSHIILKGKLKIHELEMELGLPFCNLKLLNDALKKTAKIKMVHLSEFRLKLAHLRLCDNHILS